MYKLLTPFLLSLPFSLSAMNGFFDVDVNFDPMNMKSKSHVDISPQTSLPFSDKAWLVSPRFSIYMDGSFDVAIATGMRHTTPWGYLGHHAFWSVSQTKQGKFHQVGHSFDFLTPRWDFRINYYHPLTKTQMDNKFLYTTHIWAESEALWKGKYFNVGFGPRYNFTTEYWGGQSRIVFPFKYFNLGAIVGYDYRSQFTFAVSFSFSLYNSTRTSQLNDHVSHKSRVRFEKTELPIFNKAKAPKEEPKKDTGGTLGVIKEEPKPEGEQAAPIVEEQPIVEEPQNDPVEVLPPEPTPPTQKSWWSFFTTNDDMSVCPEMAELPQIEAFE